MSAKPDVSSAELLEALPGVEDAIFICMTWKNNSFANNLISGNNLCAHTSLFVAALSRYNDDLPVRSRLPGGRLREAGAD